MRPVISVENLSKTYRLGQIGTGTFSNDLKVWAARLRGKPNPMLRIGQEDQSHRSGEILWALKDVSFQVEQGEVLGIIGRNGAGKSTLLKILSRVTAPTSGCVKVKGRIASLLEVGTGFHPELTGCENIYLNGAILGMTKEEVKRRFDEIVAFAEIEKFIDTPVKRYSSGMYVRLAFAVAAHLESEILLVDEVLAVGDAEFQKKCLGKMGDVANREGRTVLFVSHNMAAVSNICNKTAIISQGQISNLMQTSNGINYYLDSISNKKPENGLKDLSGITERKGNGPIKFIRFFCEDENGKLVREFISGKKGKLVLEYESMLKNQSVSGVEVSIIIYTSDGLRIANLWNVYENGVGFSNIPNVGRFECTLPKIPFRAGKYLLDVYCEVNKICSDWVQLASSFNVTDGDYYGSGKIPNNAVGIVFLDNTWEVNGISKNATK